MGSTTARASNPAGALKLYRVLYCNNTCPKQYIGASAAEVNISLTRFRTIRKTPDKHTKETNRRRGGAGEHDGGGGRTHFYLLLRGMIAGAPTQFFFSRAK